MAAVALAAALAPVVVTAMGSRQDTATVYADAQAEFPNETAADVAAYADRVVLVTVTQAEEVTEDAPPERVAAGEGLINRLLTVRVDASLWERPGTRAMPSTFDVVWWGWTVNDHKRTRLVGDGAPWLEVGRQYVMPVKYRTDRWEAIQPFATFAVRDRAIDLSHGQDTPLARQLSGTSVNTVTEALTARDAAGG